MLLLNFVKECIVINSINNSVSKSECFDTVSYELDNGKNVELIFDNDSVRIIDSYKLNYEERLETITFIKKHLKRNGIRDLRTIQNYEGELYFHSLSYRLGICKGSSKDADLEYKSDSRIQVRVFTIIIQILGL